MNILMLAVFLLVPCMAVGAEKETICATITMSPFSVPLCSGQTADVYITVLDKGKAPLAKHKVTAMSNRPELVAVEPKEALTDEKGKAIFKLKGLADLEDWCPIYVSFSCEDREFSMHIY